MIISTTLSIRLAFHLGWEEEIQVQVKADEIGLEARSAGQKALHL